ncbi:MAG: hypothetical protein IJG68_08290 [Bacilli bacterium]|nr:hypothetical protein [Bacilli bacterium]
MNVYDTLQQAYPNCTIKTISQNGYVTGYYIDGGYRADSIYIPMSAVNNSNVRMVSYMPGAGGKDNDAAVLRNRIQTNPPDYIVSIAPTCDDSHRCIETGYNAARNVNGNVSENVTMCFSASGDVGVYHTADFLSNHPNVKSTIVSCEPYREVNFKNTGQLTTLANTKTPIIFAVPNNWYKVNGDDLDDFKKYGIDAYIMGTNYGEDHHMQTNNNIVSSGFLDYLLGKSDSFDKSAGGGDGYSFYKYDPTTGQVVPADFSEVVNSSLGIPDIESLLTPDAHTIGEKDSPVNDKYKTLKELPDIGNIELVEFSSNYKIVYENMNQIRSQVKSSSFLNGIVNLKYRSKNDIPGCITPYLNNYFDIVGSLLNTVSMETESIMSYAEAIVNLDNELAEEENKGKTGTIVEKDNSGKYIEIGLPEEEEEEEDNNTQTPVQSTTQQGNNITYNNVPSNNATPTSTPTTTQSPGTYSYPTSSGGPSYSYPVGATTAAAPIVSQLVNNNSNNNQQEEKPVEETKEEIDRTGPCYDEEVEPDYLYGFDDHKGYIYMEDGKVTGIKYRYDYDTEEECKEKLEEIAEKYKDDKNIKDIYQKDNYIDIVFDEKSFEEKTIEEIIEEYFEGGIVRYGKNLL